MEHHSENQPSKNNGRLIPDPPPPPPPPPPKKEARLVRDHPPPPHKKNSLLVPLSRPPSENNGRLDPNPEQMADNELYEKEVDELTDEELIYVCHVIDEVDIQTLRDEYPKLQKCRKQLEESEGFHCDEMPKNIFNPLGGIWKLECDRDRWPESYEKYMNLAKFAIEDYNEKNNTEFVVLKVNSVNMSVSCYETFYMTFTAENVLKDNGSAPADSSSCKTFQAKIHYCDNKIKRFTRLEFCRVKDASISRL